MILTTTWNPRGEAQRLIRLLPVLMEVYGQILVTTPPEAIIGEAGMRQTEELKHQTGLEIDHSKEWRAGRYTALKRAYELGAESAIGCIQYADMDRLLRWVETRPGEWRETAGLVERADCLVIGRSPNAYATHPRALVETEAISNRVVSAYLGRYMDVSAGSKGFSFRAAEYLVSRTQPRSALGTDAEWPLILHGGGFRVDYVEVLGLDWESADRYQEQAADRESQRNAAEAYDVDPAHWEYRVSVAFEIVDAALRVMGGE